MFENLEEPREETVLDRVEDAIGKSFSVEIVENVMHITPAEAGISLFGFIEMTENDYQTYERHIDRLGELLLEKSEDNARLRDVLEAVIPILENHGYPELVSDILNTSYPVVGITDDGERVRFEDGK